MRNRLILLLSIALFVTGCASNKTQNTNAEYVSAIKNIDANVPPIAVITSDTELSQIDFCWPGDDSCNTGLVAVNFRTGKPANFALNTDSEYWEPKTTRPGLCSWLGCEKTAESSKYDSYISTGFFDKKVAWNADTLLMQTMGNVMFGLPLIMGMHASYAVPNPEKIEAKIAQLNNDALNIKYQVFVKKYHDHQQREMAYQALEKEKRERREAAEKAERERREAQARQNWRNALQAKKNVGDKICTWDGNKMGYVDAISGSKVKVIWSGTVIHQLNGFFFRGVIGDYSYQKPNTSSIWADSSEWAKCDFRDN